MKHSATLDWCILVLRTRMFALGAARRVDALAAARRLVQSVGAVLPALT
jgi:hypothetical protein